MSLAGLDIEVLFTPGHSPGHLTFSLPAHAAILSGDVLFQGSIGRTDLPFADHATLERSLATLIDTLPPETTVYPGHMGVTTLGRELATNPFLVELRSARQAPPAEAAPVRGGPRPDGVVGSERRQLRAADRITTPRGTSDVLGEHVLSARRPRGPGACDPRGRRL